MSANVVPFKQGPAERTRARCPRFRELFCELTWGAITAAPYRRVGRAWSLTQGLRPGLEYVAPPELFSGAAKAVPLQICPLPSSHERVARAHTAVPTSRAKGAREMGHPAEQILLCSARLVPAR